jgi:hypothetical protein
VHLGAPGCAGDMSGHTNNKSGRADDEPGSTREHPLQVWEGQRQSWKHLAAPATSLGAPQITVEQLGKGSSLGMLLVCLEIIATTYCSTSFETHVFSLYSDICIYIATQRHTVYRVRLQAVLVSNSRGTGQWQLTELRDTLQGRDRASLEMPLEVVIECIWRYTWRL